MLGDFHTHTFLSDGTLSPLELIRRAHQLGLQAIALTDHAGPGSMERIIEEIKKDCALASQRWNILAIPGIELTHLPPMDIPQAARRAKELGAWLVVVHGESPIEPVEPGTNRIAVTCPHVDILAHPGLLTPEEARVAAQNQVFLELTARRGHCLANGYVLKITRLTGARLLVCSDAHDEGEILSPALFRTVALGAGLSEEELAGLENNAQLLLNRLPLRVDP